MALFYERGTVAFSPPVGIHPACVSDYSTLAARTIARAFLWRVRLLSIFNLKLLTFPILVPQCLISALVFCSSWPGF